MRLQVFGKQISFTVVLFLRSSIEESERVDYLSKVVWKPIAPFKVCAFIWEAWGGLNTLDRVKRRSPQLTLSPSTHHERSRSVDHLQFHFRLLLYVGTDSLQQGLLDLPGQFVDFLKHWRSCRLSKPNRTLWNGAGHVVAWSIWLECNSRLSDEEEWLRFQINVI